MTNLSAASGKPTEITGYGSIPKQNLFPIVVYPSRSLRQKAVPVTEFDEKLKEILPFLAASMFHLDGYAIAAPQIGLNVRLIVVAREAVGSDYPIAFVNPEITWTSAEQEMAAEGCLSFPHIFVNVRRYKSVRIKAQNAAGEHFEMEATGLFARALQHEVEHLDGILLIDHASTLKREAIKKRMRRFIKQLKTPRR